MDTADQTGPAAPPVSTITAVTAAQVTAGRPEATRRPFGSWTGGAAPAGYFRPGDPGMAEFYAQHGYLVLQGALSGAEVEALNAETLDICRGRLGEVQGLPEVEPGEPDDAVLARTLCVHFPHKLSPAMRAALGHPALVEVLTQVVGPNVKAMQSMLFIKASGKPGQAWHQDEFFIPTRDRSLTGGWIALDDATVENGCLWVIPGSHRSGVLWPQHQQRDPRFDCTGEATFFPYTDADAVPVEVRRGSAVFFNGHLLHRSLPNYAPGGYRRVLVNHYMRAESLLPWGDPVSGPVGAADYRDVVLVAGQDPYAWKGLEDRARPHVRPSGEGGCGTPDDNAERLRARHTVLLGDPSD